MSWSIGAKGKRDEVLVALRAQIRSNDDYCQTPTGMSDAENQLRRAAQTLLYETVRANCTKDKGTYSNLVIIDASAWGSEQSDHDGNVIQSLGVKVMVHADAAPAVSA